MSPSAPTGSSSISTSGSRDAHALIPYLDALGISDLYASPYLQARAGSLHGYDISNHNRLNPEIGSEEEHERLTRELRRRGMGHLLDIVPNHMGIGHSDNHWWIDVLENGPSSAYAPFFDIDWAPLKPELTGKVLLPVLGDQYGRVLEKGELKLRYDGSRFRIEYYDQWFPVSPKSMSLVLRRVVESMKSAPDAREEDTVELESIVTALEHLPPRYRTDEASVAERKRENVVSRRRVAALHEGSRRVPRGARRRDRRVQRPCRRPAQLRRARRAARRPAVPALVLARGRGGDQLPPLLRHQRPRGRSRGAARCSRRRTASSSSSSRRARSPVCGSTTRTASTIRTRLPPRAAGGVHPEAGRHSRLHSRREDPHGRRAASRDWPVAGTVGYDFLNRVNGLFVAVQQRSG
jgi:hypothetical protein